MEFKSGDRVRVESESTERPPQTGVIEEVVQGTAYPRYRIRWDDGHESIYTPAAGALHSAEPAENGPCSGEKLGLATSLPSRGSARR